MGGSKKQTIGYWYHPAIHLVMCKGPIDAFLRFRGGDLDAWTGEVTSNATITIDAPNLWGGEEAEGGIQGDVDLMFGAADQVPNPAIDSLIGPDGSAHRGHAGLLFKAGRYGAMNPYPKPMSVLVRRILEGWDGDVCWYPETAPISMGALSVPYDGVWAYQVEAPGSSADYSSPSYDDSGWATGPGGFGSNVPPGSGLGLGTFVAGQIGKAIWIRRQVEYSGETVIDIYHDDGAWLWVDGNPVVLESVNYYHSRATVNLTGVSVIALKVMDGVPSGSPNIYAGIEFTGGTPDFFAINPAHLIYYSLTAANMQGEPVELINDASFRAGADTFYAEGLGLCTDWDPDQETVEQFRQRICNVVAANCTRSPVNGQWYLDLVRGDYDLGSLPILVDDDILEFEADPTVMDDAVNQIAVKWFDPMTKQARTTAPLHALGAIEASGINAETLDYSAIPTESLALRCAEREVRARSTPLWRWSITTSRKPYSWRRGTYFRLQAPKRGIADAVCLLGDIDRGSLRSGAIPLVAVQDVYAMPETTYVTGQPPVPPAAITPVPVVDQAAFEAPYVELAGALPAGELAALDADAGYLMTVAASPGVGLNYQLNTRPAGGEYEADGLVDWCPTATLAAVLGRTGTVLSLADAQHLERVTVGMAVLVGSEICRVDAIDTGAPSVTLGRECGDTVAEPHAAGTRLWFYDSWSGSDSTEYVTAEEVQAKLLTRTGTALLPIADAVELSLVFDQRAFRPYPPAHLLVNGEPDPVSAIGEVTVTWRHRDRLGQADQLVDYTVASVGPEAGTTYTVRWFLNGSPVHTETGVAGTTASYTPLAGGLLRVEVESVRDGVTSWQMQVREVPVGSPLQDESGALITTELAEPILME